MNVRCLGLGLIGSCFRKLFLRTFFGNTKNTKKSSLKTLLCILNLVFFFMFFIIKPKWKPNMLSCFPCF